MTHRDIWYSVQDETRFVVNVIEGSWRQCAIDAAEDYHNNHDGWESDWPLEFVLYESQDGPEIARFDVERETVPSFYAKAKS